MKKLLVFLIFALFQISLISALTVDSVTTIPEEIAPGEMVDIRLSIENNLNSDADNVEVVLNLDSETIPFAPYQSSNEVLIEEIEEGDEESARFTLIAFSDAAAGTYKIPLTITYFLGNDIKETTGMISLIVSAKPKLEIYEEGSVLIRGQKGELVLEIINSGLGNAKLLTLRVSEPAGIKIFGSNTVYIGNIDSDDFERVDFEVLVKEGASSSIPITIYMSYLDSSNNEKKETKSLSVKTYSQDEAVELGLIKKSNTSTIIIVIVVVIVLFLLYRFIRKKRRRK